MLMCIKRLYITIVLISLVFAGVLSQTPANKMKDVQGFREKLVAMSDRVSTIESDFVQEKKLSILSNTIISKGKFWFKKENNIRWEYLQPFQYLIIISNGKIFIKEDKNQKQYDVQSNRMFEEMNRFISGCIQGDILKNDEEFVVSYFEDEKSYYVSLVPKAASLQNMLKEVNIWFNRTDLTVNRIIMVEPGGDYTRIDFTNKKLNTDIALEKFSFK